MATAREIHRHMKGIKNIGQITKAMKMVAAARLRKAQEKAGSSRPYALKIKEVLANIVCDKGMVAGLDAKKHPLLQKREVKKIGYLVVCSDKGLAGAYSSNALKKAVAEISEIEDTARISSKIIVLFSLYDFFIAVNISRCFLSKYDGFRIVKSRSCGLTRNIPIRSA